MAGIQTLPHRFSTPSVGEEFFFTRGRLRRHRHTKALATDFEAFRPKLDAALAEELLLLADRHEADAGVEFIDEELDALLDAIATVSLIEAKHDRGAMPYARYFASQRPSEMKRPILGGQLETMRSWVPSLKSSSNALLQQYGTDLEAKVGEADNCTEAQAAAAQKLTDFRTIGTRRQLIDEFNALRKYIHGKLGELQHKHQDLGNGWADSFFRQGSSERVTLKEIDRRIGAAEMELATLKKQREHLAGQEEAALKAKAEAERAQKLAELQAAKKAAAELAARMAELEASLEPGAQEK